MNLDDEEEEDGDNEEGEGNDDDVASSSNRLSNGWAARLDGGAPEGSSSMSSHGVAVSHSVPTNARASPPSSPCSLNSTLDETLNEDSAALLLAEPRQTRKDEYGKATRIATASTLEPSSSINSGSSSNSSGRGVVRSTSGGSLGSAVAAAAAAVSAAMTAAEEGEASHHLPDDNIVLSEGLRLEDVLRGSGMGHDGDDGHESGSEDAFDEDEEHRKLMAAMESAL